jgi:glyoxylase-like metal-dependent hydrolase (beta-lactamase superfamily II)
VKYYQPVNLNEIAEIPYPSLDPRVRVFRHGGFVDTAAILTQRYLVIVDTGIRPEGMAEEMALLLPSLGHRAVLVVNTHGDWDHVWGNSVFLAPDAPHPAPVLGSRPAADAVRRERESGLLASMQSEHPGIYDSVQWFAPSILLEGRTAIDGGDMTVEIFPTPGHTPDHLSLWIPELRLLHAGDAAEFPFPVVSEHGSLDRIRASLRAMAALSPATAIYCHAPGRTDPTLLHENLAYFDELDRRVRAGEEFPLQDALPLGADSSDWDYAEFHARNLAAARASVG